MLNILNGYLEQGESYDYKSSILQIFKEPEFFNLFPQYLEICIVGNDQNKFNSWSGFVESKIRVLIEKLDQFYSIYNVEIRLIPKIFQKEYPNMKQVEGSLINDFKFCSRLFVGLEIFSSSPINIDLA